MTNKLKYFIGNWKMFGDLASFKIISKINRFSSRLKKSNRKNKIVLCVPNTLIYPFRKKLKSKFISLGAQNCHYHEGYGSFTGSVNASMLKKTGAEYVILGHSENRQDGESNEIIKKKIKSCLNMKLNIIFCIGETLKEKNNSKTFLALRKQIKSSLEYKFNIDKILFAYEPIWSIGTNKIPNIKTLKNTVEFIKKEYMKIFGTKKIPKVLYGGSVNEINIKIFNLISEIDGFLIGGASHSSKKFIDIIKNYYK